jgi:hypothetical protein
MVKVMAKLIRSGESFSSALRRIHEIMQKGSYDSDEYNELQMLKWLVLEYEEKYGFYNQAEENITLFQSSEKYKIAL